MAPSEALGLAAVWTNPGFSWTDGQVVTVSLTMPSVLLVATRLDTTGARLTVRGHTTAWWYKKTAPTPAGDCTSVAAGTTFADLTGLTPGTSYTYKAYSASGCGAADELASRTFTAGAHDVRRPSVVNYGPADDAMSVARNTDLVLTFDERVKKGTGSIIIRPSSGSDVTIPVGNAQVSVSGRTVTINPSADLTASTAYHVRIPTGAIEDLLGNDHAGIADATTWNFTTATSTDTTAPTVGTYAPADGANGVARNANLVLTFNEPVRKGSGNIVVNHPTGTANDLTIPVTDDRVSVGGSTVTIDPTGDLLASVNYSVQIASGAIEDLAGNDYGGIGNTTTWDFTTGANATAPLAPTVTATARDRRVKLSWTPNASGSPATGWQWQHRVQASGACSTTDSDYGAWASSYEGGTTRYFMHNRLTNGTRYCFRVRGVHTSGGTTLNGAASAGQAVTPVANTKPVVKLSNLETHTVEEGSSIDLTVTMTGGTLAAAVVLPLRAVVINSPDIVNGVVTEPNAEPGDYTLPLTVTIPANQTSATFRVRTHADDDNDNEFMRVVFGGVHRSFPSSQVEPWYRRYGPDGIYVQGTWAGLTITEAGGGESGPEDGATAAVSLSASPDAVEEGAPVTVTATLSKALASGVTIPLVVTNVTAEDADYTAPPPIAIAAGSTTGTSSMNMAMDADGDDETFRGGARYGEAAVLGDGGRCGLDDGDHHRHHHGLGGAARAVPQPARDGAGGPRGRAGGADVERRGGRRRLGGPAGLRRLDRHRRHGQDPHGDGSDQRHGVHVQGARDGVAACPQGQRVGGRVGDGGPAGGAGRGRLGAGVPQGDEPRRVVGRPGAGDALRCGLERRRGRDVDRGGIEPRGDEPLHFRRRPHEELHRAGAGAERGRPGRLDRLGLGLVRGARRAGLGERHPQREQPRRVVGCLGRGGELPRGLQRRRRAGRGAPRRRSRPAPA